MLIMRDIQVKMNAINRKDCLDRVKSIKEADLE